MSNGRSAPEDLSAAQEHFRRTEAIFRDARAIEDPEERAAHVTAACGDDDTLLQEVSAWLAGHDEGERAAESTPRPLPQLADTVWTAAQQESAETPQTLGRYRIRRLIGTGGMGTVYEAEQEDPERVVALKLLHPELDDEGLRRRFRMEADVLARLEHEGIAHVYDVGEIETQLGPRLFIAMERVSGVPLGEFVRRQRPGREACVRLLIRICDAVRHAHRNGVIHRDLKPSNILVRADGSPKLLDFGVAQRTDVESDLTRTGHIVGTLGYMSPEQAQGMHVDSRADIFSVGVIGYEMLAGRHPRESVTPVTGGHASPALGTHDPDLRGDISVVFAKALETDPDRRYQDVGAFAEDLRRYLDGEPILARPPSATYQLRMFVGRHKPLVATAAAGLAALVVGLFLALGAARREEAERQRADAQAKEASAAAYLATIKAVASDIAMADPSAARLLLEGLPPSDRGWEWHYLQRRLDGSADALPLPSYDVEARKLVAEARLGDDRRLKGLDVSYLPVRGDEFDYYARHAVARIRDARDRVLMSPYAERLEPFVHVPGTPHTWHLERDLRNVLTLTAAPDAPPVRKVRLGTRMFDMVVSPDGTTLALGGRDTAVVLLDAADGAQRARLRGHFREVRSLAFDAGGERLASGAEDGVIRIWDVTRGLSVRTLLGHRRRVEQLAFLPDDSGLLSLAADGVRLWDFEAEAALHVLRRAPQAEARYVYDLAVSPDGRRVASTAFSRRLEITSLETGDVLWSQPFEGRYRGIKNFTVRFSPDGRWIAACEGPPHLWDAHTGELAWRVPRTVKMGALVFDAQRGEILAIGDSGLHGFALEDGRAHLVRPLAAEDASVSIDMAPGGRRYAYALDEAVFVYVRGSERLVWRGAHEEPIIEVRFSPDGAQLATASRDGTVRLWDAATGEILHRLRGHEARVYAVAFSPDGRRLASGGHDSAIRLWDTASGASTLVIRGHDDYVHALAFDPGGETLVSGSGDGTVRTWSTRPMRERCRARAALMAAAQAESKGKR